MKNTIKKIISIAIAAVIVTAAFSGCSGTGKNKTVNVGITQFADNASLDNCRTGFIEGMKESGYVEGKNVKYDYQSAHTDTNNANTIAQSFVNKGYDLICAIATPSAQAAYNAASTKKIPVIFEAVSDPVKAEIVNSLEKPGKGTTGTTDILPVRKQLEMIRAFLPKAKKIGILYNTSEVNSLSQIKEFEKAAPEFGFEIVKEGVADSSNVPLAADSILTKVDCLNNLTDNLVVSQLATILNKANAKKIPVFGSEEEQVKSGCLASVGIDYYKLGIQSGKMAARVLKGEDINAMSVVKFEDSKLAVNQKTMNSFGFKVPDKYSNNVTIEK